MIKNDMIASVDLGSNSFRLQISINNNGQPQIVDSIKEMVRFASGLDEKKNLSDESQTRALKCLSRFGERLRGFNPEQVRVVATNTFRIAKNIQPFIKKAEKSLGFPIEIIAGREEARLIYTGVVHTLSFNQRKALVVDIGGGSTEFIVGNSLNPEITESLPLGCVSYSIRFFPEGKITQNSFQNAINAAKLEIQRIRESLQDSDWQFAIGTSGSARSIRDVIQALYPEKEIITLSSMQKIAQTIINCNSTKKAKLNGLKPDRVEVFAGGLAIMIAVFEELNIDEMMITDAALRDGVFFDLVGRSLKDMREETIEIFQKRYHIDLPQAQRVRYLALKCFQATSIQLTETEYSYWHHLLSWSADLHEIGLSISHTGYHKHSAYIVEHADMPGFSRSEQQLLSLLILGHRGDLKKMVHYFKNPILCLTMMCLRLATLLYRARIDIHFPDTTTIQINLNKKKCTVHLEQNWLQENPLTHSALEYESQQWLRIGYYFNLKYI